ncbi:hypothetical protein B9Z19DRAFT_1124812 [Tuber borchii]|uniref:DUF6532 domain-containing protein n=1 Tax=Tuber borchii TaxID=42251 RepID=A0A2T6ZW58_TUBBO|nr:hypothetical protein B9Z19DRAFT_1124812 [Tuber borchii]
MELNGQEHLEMVHLSDDSSDAYQNLDDAEETESDTEPDIETLDIEEGTALARRHGSQAVGQQRNSDPITVRISTTSGFITTSGVSNSSPRSEPGIPSYGRIGPAIDSQRNTVIWAEGAILGKAKALMLRYTRFDNPLPNAVALTSQVYTVWSKVQDTISDAGYIDPSEENLNLLRGKYTAVRGQFLFHIRTNIKGLYSLPKDPTAMVPRIEYLLEGDRFMCSSNGYENLTFRFLAPQIANAIYGKYFDGVKMQGMLDQGFLKRINGNIICLTCAMLCHVLRAWQTGIFKTPAQFKHDVVRDLFVRQRNTWLGFAKETQKAFVLNLHWTMTRRLENQHSIRPERREGFTEDNDAVYAELQHQLAVRSLPVGWGQDSLDPLQETDTSLDFSQMSVDLESGFLDSDPAGPEDGCRQTEELGLEEARSPDPSSPLSLSLEYFEAGEVSPGGGVEIYNRMPRVGRKK